MLGAASTGGAGTTGGAAGSTGGAALTMATGGAGATGLEDGKGWGRKRGGFQNALFNLKNP